MVATRNNIYKVERIDNERTRDGATIGFVVAAENPAHARLLIAQLFEGHGKHGLADVWGSSPAAGWTKTTRLGIANVTLKPGIIIQGA
jgi:hypothetical protein